VALVLGKERSVVAGDGVRPVSDGLAMFRVE